MNRWFERSRDDLPWVVCACLIHGEELSRRGYLPFEGLPEATDHPCELCSGRFLLDAVECPYCAALPACPFHRRRTT